MWLGNFNPSKTKTMTVSNRNLNYPPLTCDNKQLEQVKSHKHLGITISDDLSWTNHVNTITESVSKMLNVLERLKYRLDRKTLESICLSFVRPKLEYSSSVWSNLSKNNIEKLEDLYVI